MKLMLACSYTDSLRICSHCVFALISVTCLRLYSTDYKEDAVN